MKTTTLFAAAWSLVLATTPWAMATEDATPPPRPSIPIVQASYGKLPLSFEANHGQWDPSVQFVTRGRGHQLFLTSNEAVLTVRTGSAQPDGGADHATQPQQFSSPSPSSHSVVHMQFAGADPQAEVVGLEPLPGIVNYFIGDDPTKWRTNIPTFQKVGYKDLYPGIDLVYYGNQGQLEYDLVVAPGADPNQIMLAFDGAERITVDEQGDLVLTLASLSTETAERAATIRLQKPVVYQRDEQGDKHLLAGAYVLRTSTTASSSHLTVAVHSSETTQVAFQIAAYDASQPLIIDPVLSWAIYLGIRGGDVTISEGIAVDAAGHVYVTGDTGNYGFPGTFSSPIQSMFGGTQDAFVTKFNATGTAILYSTYLGGDNIDVGNKIAVDAAGNAYVTGWTDSSNFPGTAGSPIQSTNAGENAFVTKLNATGSAIVYSTYLGGSLQTLGRDIAVDQAGNAYVTGFTSSSDFPGTVGSHIQSTFGGDSDAFVTKLNAAGTAILYSTYLGGSGSDEALGIAVDAAGHAYVVGHTNSSSFPGTSGSQIQNTFGGGTRDAFVTKLNAAGTAILYSTYLGGSSGDYGYGIALDTVGNAYVTGHTNSLRFPGTANSPIQSTKAGFYDAFVTKLNATGTVLVYSTYLGGTGSIGYNLGADIAVDQAGSIYVMGSTNSSNFPGTAGSAIQSTFGGGTDAFVVKITSTSTVNDLVTFVPLASSYRTTADPTGCPSGFVETFGFDARLTSKNSSPPLSDLAVQVKTLTNGNLLQNADGGNGGVGSTLTVPKTHGYADGTLSHGESVDVHFSICLKARKPFSFFVDVLGMH